MFLTMKTMKFNHFQRDARFERMK